MFSFPKSARQDELIYDQRDFGGRLQVLVNLLSNSLKFTKTGTITLRAIVEKMRDVNEAGQEVRPESIDVANQDLRKQVCVRFEVEDTGKGIARSEIPKLFKTYSQSKLSK